MNIHDLSKNIYLASKQADNVYANIKRDYFFKYLRLQRLTQKKGHPNPLLRQIYKDVHKEMRNALVLVEGQTGSGKSNICLRAGYDLDPYYHPLKNVVFGVSPFFNLVNNRELTPVGTTIDYEEAGVSVNNRNWRMNEEIINLMQTFRRRRLVVFMNVPAGCFVDAKLRKLFHYNIEAIRVLHDKGINLWYGSELKYYPFYDDTRNKYVRGYDHHGTWRRWELFKTQGPPTFIKNEYEKMEESFKDQLAIDEGKRQAAKELKKQEIIKNTKNQKLMAQLEEKVDIMDRVKKNIGLFEKRIGRRWVIDLNMLKSKFGSLKGQTLKEIKAEIESTDEFKKKNAFNLM